MDEEKMKELLQEVRRQMRQGVDKEKAFVAIETHEKFKEFMKTLIDVYSLKSYRELMEQAIVYCTVNCDDFYKFINRI